MAECTYQLTGGRALLVVYGSVFLLACSIVFASDNAKHSQSDLQIVPLAQWESQASEEQHLNAWAGGVLVINEEDQYSLIFSQLALEHAVNEEGPRLFSALDAVADLKNNRHNYLAVLKTQMQPDTAINPDSAQLAAVYGYEWLSRPNLSLTLGGGVAVGDFGIETADGNNWPLIPLPFIRFSSQSEWLDMQLEFLTSPSLNLVLAPEKRLRLKTDIRFDQLRDSYDLITETALLYRLFSADSPIGDFAGLAVGFKSDSFTTYGYHLDAEYDPVEFQYQAIFTTIDLTLMTFTAGYTVNSRTRFSDSRQLDSGEGVYFLIQGMYAF